MKDAEVTLGNEDSYLPGPGGFFGQDPITRFLQGLAVAT
jgi:hypothetical protein